MHDDRPLQAAEWAYKAGECGWEAVQATQADLMPRCKSHNAPTSIIIGDEPICAACITEAGASLKLWLKSLQVVSGGVPL